MPASSVQPRTATHRTQEHWLLALVVSHRRPTALGAGLALSISLHATALMVAATSAWRVGYSSDTGVLGEASTTTSLVLADLAPPQDSAQPLPTLAPAPATTATTDPTRHAASDATTSAPQDDFATRSAPRRGLIEDAPAGGMVTDAPAPSQTLPEPAQPLVPRASFAGVEALPARRVVYLIDGSGPMAASLGFVQVELVRSVDRLLPDQQFQAMVFREVAGQGAQAPTGTSIVAFASAGNSPFALTPASPQAKAAVREWIRSVVPGGRSEPLRAIEAAMRLQPDIIFVLSRAIARSGVDVASRNAEILAALDRLNPRNPSTGQRAAKIKTIQFLDDDPTGLMQAIAREHGGAPGSYRLVTRQEVAAARGAGGG